MKRITAVTKRDIYDLFLNGIEIKVRMFDTEIQKYPYYGRLTAMEFLKRLYKLDKMPSKDSRFPNAEVDIWQHTVNNDDYPICWVFEDERFPLKSGSDEEYLRFLCEIFNPEVRDDNSLCKEYLRKINELLCTDRYELYPNSQISGKDVYGWRSITEKEAINGRFLPFSVRHEEEIEKHKLSICTIPKKMRKKIIALMGGYETQENLTDETGYHYSQYTKAAVLDDIREYYAPKAFDQAKKYSDVDNLDRFVTDNYPQYVFDAIELFAKHSSEDNFTKEVNLIIRDLGYQLLGGKIELSQQKVEIKEPEHNDDLKYLIQQAESYYRENDSDSLQRALEKLWDAFERLRTYDNEDKKQSVHSIEAKIAGNNPDLKERLDREFKELANIGNGYQIRHFEKGKIPISDNRIREYLYLRCSALINLSIKFIEDN